MATGVVEVGLAEGVVEVSLAMGLVEAGVVETVGLVLLLVAEGLAVGAAPSPSAQQAVAACASARAHAVRPDACSSTYPESHAPGLSRLSSAIVGSFPARTRSAVPLGHARGSCIQQEVHRAPLHAKLALASAARRSAVCDRSSRGLHSRAPAAAQPARAAAHECRLKAATYMHSRRSMLVCHPPKPIATVEQWRAERGGEAPTLGTSRDPSAIPEWLAELVREEGVKEEEEEEEEDVKEEEEDVKEEEGKLDGSLYSTDRVVPRASFGASSTMRSARLSMSDASSARHGAGSSEKWCGRVKCAALPGPSSHAEPRVLSPASTWHSPVSSCSSSSTPPTAFGCTKMSTLVENGSYTAWRKTACGHFLVSSQRCWPPGSSMRATRPAACSDVATSSAWPSAVRKRPLAISTLATRRSVVPAGARGSKRQTAPLCSSERKHSLPSWRIVIIRGSPSSRDCHGSMRPDDSVVPGEAAATSGAESVTRNSWLLCESPLAETITKVHVLQVAVDTSRGMVGKLRRPTTPPST